MTTLLASLLLLSCGGAPDTADTAGGGLDADGDGVPASLDCNDADASVHQGAAEVCNGIDDDCNGQVDDGLPGATWYADADSDGFGDPATGTYSCDDPGPGFVDNDLDCDDADPNAWPGATERCDGVDDDCDGLVDDGAPGTTWYADADADGLGDQAVSQTACDAPPGYVDIAGDCDDADPSEPVVVDAATGSAQGGGTIDSPLDSVQAAIDLAAECVLVMPGTYHEAIDFHGRSLSVGSTAGPDQTVLDATGAESVVSVQSGETATLDGFTLQGASGRHVSSTYSWSCDTSSYSRAAFSGTCTETDNYWYGAGVYVAGSRLTLRSSVISDIALPEYSYTDDGHGNYTYDYSFAAGAYVVSASSVVLSDVWFTRLAASYAAGFLVDYGSRLTGTRTGITALESQYGSIYNYGSLTLTNAILAFNHDESALLLQAGEWLMLDQATIAYNDVPYALTNYGGAGTYAIHDSILAFGSGNGIYDQSGGAVSYTDIYGHANGDWIYVSASSGAGNISGDPLFASVTDDGDPGNDDFSLAPGSPCIDAGDPAVTDPDGGAADMGAFGGPGGSW